MPSNYLFLLEWLMGRRGGGGGGGGGGGRGKGRGMRKLPK